MDGAGPVDSLDPAPEALASVIANFVGSSIALLTLILPAVAIASFSIAPTQPLPATVDVMNR